MIIPARFNGPPGSANGGYACGLVSEALGGGFEVTLLLPPPLETELDLVGTSSETATFSSRARGGRAPRR